MTQSDSDKKDQSSSEVKPSDNDSALTTGMERLAFKLHDFANRLMGYLR
tara:strand:- start:36 stop:182 length:147 start_codon:yes stop_codon:yes gene_type:complete